MTNPGALTDDVLDKIEALLREFRTELENHGYKRFNITQDVKDIREALDAIQDARHGTSDDDIMRACMEFETEES